MKIGFRLHFWMLALSPGRKGAELTEGSARLYAHELRLCQTTIVLQIYKAFLPPG